MATADSSRQVTVGELRAFLEQHHVSDDAFVELTKVDDRVNEVPEWNVPVTGMSFEATSSGYSSISFRSDD